MGSSIATRLNFAARCRCSTSINVSAATYANAYTRVNMTFHPVSQSVLQPGQQPVCHGIHSASLPAPPPRVSHVIQPVLQPVIQVAQSMQGGRLEPHQVESLYSQEVPTSTASLQLQPGTLHHHIIPQLHLCTSHHSQQQHSRITASVMQPHLMILPVIILLPIHHILLVHLDLLHTMLG